MIMTMYDKLVYDNSTLCHICNEELGNDRVRDHCHLSGKFRGAAHEVCNLKYKVPLWIGCSLVFQCAWSYLGCHFKNYKGSTRIIKRSRHVTND